MPFAVAAADGVLTLTLDTPGSAINVFTHATAHQLIDILSDVTPSTTRAIVFQTAKPNSFINGVGLLLAHASRTYDDIVRASLPPWRAYRAVREAPVPTIAVVQGNCFGCGVEFALNCTYRIASDTCETKFYMTELNDYLFIPLFGSTWNLPEAVGLDDAVNLLLWGERWSAQKAFDRGLVDEAVPHEQLAERARRFVQRVVDGTQPSRRRGRVAWGATEEAVQAAARRRIESFPPQYRQVYTDALDLLEAGARQHRTYADHQQQELVCSAASALSPIGKSAYAFFYLRQMASERAGGRVRGAAAPVVTLATDIGVGESGREFVDDLRARRLPGVRFTDAETADFRFVAIPSGARQPPAPHGHGDTAVPPEPPSAWRNGRGIEIAVQVSLAAAPAAAVELYAPLHRTGGRLIELAIRSTAEPSLGPDAAARLIRTLQRFGFEIARTTPTATFVSHRLLLAYFLPLVRCVESGGDVAVINAELCNAGFVQRPHHLLAALDRSRVAVQLSPHLGCAPSVVEPLLTALASDAQTAHTTGGVVIDALCISLLEAVLAARAGSETRDTMVIDLIARELLDFPRHLCSLCTWLKRARVARAAERDRQVRSLVTAAAFEAACVFVAEGREFYR